MRYSKVFCFRFEWKVFLLLQTSLNKFKYSANVRFSQLKCIITVHDGSPKTKRKKVGFTLVQRLFHIQLISVWVFLLTVSESWTVTAEFKQVCTGTTNVGDSILAKSKRFLKYTRNAQNSSQTWLRIFDRGHSKLIAQTTKHVDSRIKWWKSNDAKTTKHVVIAFAISMRPFY